MACKRGFNGIATYAKPEGVVKENYACEEPYTKGFLYSMWSGRLVVYEGAVKVCREGQPAIFCVKNVRKVLRCSEESGLVYNSMVWLEERKDADAKKILIYYEKEMIEAMQEKINNHKARIKSIRESKL